MQPIQINVVCLEAAQGAVQRAIDVLSAIAPGVGIALFRIKREFCGEDHSVAESAIVYKFPDQFFALAIGVSIGGVDEISTCIDVAIEEGARNIFFGSPSPLGAEGHGAKT